MVLGAGDHVKYSWLMCVFQVYSGAGDVSGGRRERDQSAHGQQREGGWQGAGLSQG
jgi:hypothetical protein